MTSYNINILQTPLSSENKELLKSLLPNMRHFSGSEWCIGDRYGSPGKSLKINIDNGLWRDFSTGESGHIRQLAPVQNYLASVRKNSKIEGNNMDRTTYTYQSEDGKPYMRVYRIDASEGEKKFWVHDCIEKINKYPQKRILYNLPEVLEADHVVLVEGEKAADAVNKAGLKGIVGTTLAGGCNTSLPKNDLSPLYGKKVTLWADNDENGIKLMNKIADLLKTKSTLYTVNLENMPAKGDAADIDIATLRKLISSATPQSNSSNCEIGNKTIIAADIDSTDLFEKTPEEIADFLQNSSCVFYESYLYLFYRDGLLKVRKDELIKSLKAYCIEVEGFTSKGKPTIKEIPVWKAVEKNIKHIYKTTCDFFSDQIIVNKKLNLVEKPIAKNIPLNPTVQFEELKNTLAELAPATFRYLDAIADGNMLNMECMLVGLAMCAQGRKPGERAITLFLWSATTGTGKSSFGSILMETLFHEENICMFTDGEGFLTKHNEKLMGKIAIYAEELEVTKISKTNISRLKVICSSKTLAIRAMAKDVENVPNYIAMVAMSSNEYPRTLADIDRVRIIEVPDTIKKNPTIVADMAKELAEEKKRISIITLLRTMKYDTYDLTNRWTSTEEYQNSAKEANASFIEEELRFLLVESNWNRIISLIEERLESDKDEYFSKKFGLFRKSNSQWYEYSGRMLKIEQEIVARYLVLKTGERDMGRINNTIIGFCAKYPSILKCYVSECFKGEKSGSKKTKLNGKPAIYLYPL